MVVVAAVVISGFMYRAGMLVGQVAPDGNMTDAQATAVANEFGLGPVLLSSAAGLVGFVAWVMGIVAAATSRGRAYGVFTIILGILAPIVAVGALVAGLAPYMS